jgi:hypothetical protein
VVPGVFLIPQLILTAIRHHPAVLVIFVVYVELQHLAAGVRVKVQDFQHRREHLVDLH